MIITLPDDLEQQLEAEVAAGRTKSVQAFVTSAVRAQLAALAVLNRSLDEAEAEYDAKGGIPWEDVKAHIDARLAADD
jgi:Arc/MetJ-type ribon-helix-helix transcriptional regulator